MEDDERKDDTMHENSDTFPEMTCPVCGKSFESVMDVSSFADQVCSRACFFKAAEEDDKRYEDHNR